MIKVTGFGILTPVKSSCYFFLQEIILVSCPSTLDLFFIGLSMSYDLNCVFDKLIHLTQFFITDFFLILSFNIVFD
jgi:hypothetical protein